MHFAVGHVQYSTLALRLLRLNCIYFILVCFVPQFIPKRDLEINKTTSSKEVLRTLLEY